MGILTLLVLGIAINVYITFKAVYNLGRYRREQVIPGAGRIDCPDILIKPAQPLAGDTIQKEGGSR